MKIFLALIVTEILFLIWRLMTRSRQDKEKLVIRIMALTVMGLLFLSGILIWSGSYYPIMAVVAVQAVICLIVCVFRKGKEYHAGMQLLVFAGNVFLYFTALIPAIMFPGYTQPKVTGDYGVKISEYTWTDEERAETFTDSGENREVTVKMWYPDNAQKKYPLVVFSHGAFGVIDSNYSTCMELASNGYVVASIGHNYHAMFVKNTSGKVVTADPAFVNSIYAVNDTDDNDFTYKESRKWMEIRTGDENFVLDTILQRAEADSEAPFSLINKQKIGLFGHSMGGASSVALGRERKDIGAVIDLEGTMLSECIAVENGDSVVNEEPYEVPLLDVYSEQIYNLTKQSETEVYINFDVEKKAVCYNRVIFKEAGHMNFTDLPLLSPVLAKMLGVGKAEPLACIENVNDMVLSFFNRYLKDDSNASWKQIY